MPIDYFVALDLEAISRTSVNAIGLFVGDSEGVVHLKKEYWIKRSLEEYDPRTLREFWQGIAPNVLEYALSHGLPEDMMIRAFVKDFDSIGEKLGIPDTQLKLITDNPEFDYGGLTSLVAKHCGREPLRYTIRPADPR